VRTTEPAKRSLIIDEAKSHKSEGGARKEIDTSIDCMSLTNSHLSLLSGSRDILGTVQQNDVFYNEPQSRMSSIEICFFFLFLAAPKRSTVIAIFISFFSYY
jgi:hypothetical protein